MFAEGNQRRTTKSTGKQLSDFRQKQHRRDAAAIVLTYEML